MEILKKSDMKKLTQLKLEQIFNSEIKKQIYNLMKKAQNKGRFYIELDKGFLKYYDFILKYFKKKKHYKVERLHNIYFLYGYNESGSIRISWS